MNICFCVSGQIRDNTEKPFQALQQLIDSLQLQGHNVTLVFSIWDEISRKLDGIINFKQLMKIFESDLVSLIPPNWYKSLWKKLPNLYKEVTETESKNASEWVSGYFPQAVIDSENGGLLHLMFDREVSDNNSIKMLYKIWRANQIKKNIEHRQGFVFDYVIRLRPDFTVKRINLELDHDAIYIPNAKEDHTALEDTFAMGTSKAIDYYCELFPKSILSSIRWRGIHYMLSTHIKESGFKAMATQANGFELRYMSQNLKKIDVNDLLLDLNDEFYRGIFEVVALKRVHTAATLGAAMQRLESLEPLVDSPEKEMTFFTLCHEVLGLQHQHAGALKAILLADFNQSRFDARKFSVDHRINFVFGLASDLIAKLNISVTPDFIENLDGISDHQFYDARFHSIDRSLIDTNFKVFFESAQGQQKLNANRSEPSSV